MKRTPVFLNAAVTTTSMFLGKMHKTEPAEFPILYDDFLLLEPKCSIGKRVKLKVIIRLIEGPSVETILGFQYEIEEDNRIKIVDFTSLLKKFAVRELLWLTERSQPEERLGTVKRNVQDELPKFCREAVCTPNARRMLQTFKVEATSKITQ